MELEYLSCLAEDAASNSERNGNDSRQRDRMLSILHRLDQADAYADELLADPESVADYVRAAEIQEMLDEMTERVERHLNQVR